VLDKLRVEPGHKARLADRDPADKLGLTGKAQGRKQFDLLLPKLADLQTRLAAESARGVLLVLQAMDAGGKDGTIRAVFTGLNPQGVKVEGFKVPAGRESQQDYLWRVHQVVPGRGEIGIFNRSHYEDVLVVRVHGIVPEDRWRKRYRHIREFERLLVDEGTTIVKVMLHISADEQRQRFQERIDDPAKRWKFRAGDLADRARWDDYQAAYEEALTETSTPWAPWYVVPADRNWVRDLAVATLLEHHLAELDPQYPPADPSVVGTKVV
jgi:PPK2 family polyphosphate:nucleotide phosphotransferase